MIIINPSIIPRDDLRYRLYLSFEMPAASSHRRSVGFLIGNRSDANHDERAVRQDGTGWFAQFFSPRSLWNVGDVSNARVIAREILRERQR